jgi:transitional endoplasmic reticulum ATPase
MSNPMQALELMLSNLAKEQLGLLQVTGVERKGDKIVIPEGMSAATAMEWLKRKDAEENRTVAVQEDIDAYPLDGAYALQRVLAEKYGWVDLVPTPGFWGDDPPAMVGVEVERNKSVQVPWGRIRLPNVDGWIAPSVQMKNNRWSFRIVGEVKQKHSKEVNEIASATRNEIATRSIYRGKAIQVTFPDPKKGEKFNPGAGPKFLDLSNTSEFAVIYSEDVREQVRTSLFTPIENTAACRQHKVPLKRGILLEGPYGCGKTLTAYVTAKKAMDNGWTFLYLERMSDLAAALDFASQYQPCVIFAEDLDRTMEGEDRSVAMDDVLNTIDGIESKGRETIVVLTTNHVDRINQAMIRPGRLDAVISIQPPDAKAAQELIRMYAGPLLAANENLDAVGSRLRGQIPAVIREVVERSKLHAIGHTAAGEELQVTAKDLLGAAIGMLSHLKLLEPKPEDKRSEIEKFGQVLGESLVEGVQRAAEAKRNRLAQNNNGSGEHSEEDSEEAEA